MIAVAVIFWPKKDEPNSVNTNTNGNTNTAVNTNDSVNTNESANENINDPNILTNQELTVEGTVFVKGYKTPSESYGILTTDSQEVGLGSYDSAREQFRIFVGDKVSVTFDKVCRSNRENCCRSLFFYCGTVKNYQSIK